MAIWQYSFQIIPKQSISLLNDSTFGTGDNLFDSELFWKKYPMAKDDIPDIAQLLPRRASWNKNMDGFGSIDGNCFELFYDEDTTNITSFSFRLDFTSAYSQLLHNIIELCIIKSLAILDENLNPVPLDYGSILQVIDSSPQKQKYISFLN